MKFTLSCPCCYYETPTVEICKEFPTEEDVRMELEFWLYENHPDFCPNGWTGEGIDLPLKRPDITDLNTMEEME